MSQRSALLLLVVTIASSTCGIGGPANQGRGVEVARVALPELWIDHEANKVIRRDHAGRTLWAARFNGYLGRARPHLLADALRVYVTHGDGVTALDRETGKVVWHAKGPGDRMCLAHGLLLAADRDEVEAGGRWVVARKAENGAEAFRVRLPRDGLDPLPIHEVAGLFLVQTGLASGEVGSALLIDRQGRVRHRCVRRVVARTRLGGDRVLLAGSNVVRLGPEGKARWATFLTDDERADHGGLLVVPGGDLVAFVYGRASDYGVEVARLDGGTGAVRWRSRCAPVPEPVKGSWTAEGAAVVTLKGNEVEVAGWGHHGTFGEVLDLGTGRRLKRE